ncbi:MAG TPA: hypothetical protein VFL87_08740 [Thermoleophilaceae bacterium]|nr:hypothetical protein [Thermoleophilaceae bacterium]
MDPHAPAPHIRTTRAWTTRERILAELISHGVAVPDLDPSARFVAIMRMAADYRPLARAFERLDSALRWLQQAEGEHALVDVIVDLSAPTLDTAVIRPFHVLTADDAREPLDLGSAAAIQSPGVAAAQPLGRSRLPRRRSGSPRLVQ